MKPQRCLDLALVKAILGACDLPTSDLTQKALENFFVVGDGKNAEAVIGLEVMGASALLRSLAVLPASRGKGLATNLVGFIEQHAIDLGVMNLYLLTTTASRFFESQGYTPVQRSEVPEVIQTTAEFSSLCPDDAIVMTKYVGARCA